MADTTLPPHPSFGRDLAAARAARGWSIGDAAQRADVTWKTWHRIEAGCAARPRTIRRIEQAFGVPEGVVARAYHGEVPLTRALADAPVIPRPMHADRSLDTVEQLFAAARRLPAEELRRLGHLISGAVAMLGGPERDRLLEQAAIKAGPFYERWRVANYDLEVARRTGDADVEDRAAAEIVAAKSDLNAWLVATVPDLTKEELGRVLIRLQDLG
ncbi:MAG: helix-turn-helix domain-containing protein [Saccharothrix sp.]|nr:helix-turn-helix domain-containing protein [Saccharothrix sp.]